MKLNTASAVIEFITVMEENAAVFYEKYAGVYKEFKELFTSFTKENRKNIKQIYSIYYSVITDAIEGCFAFDLETTNYDLGIEYVENSRGEVLNKAIEIEKRIKQLYLDAAELSSSLMADIPRIFHLIANKRGKRISSLENVLEVG